MSVFLSALLLTVSLAGALAPETEPEITLPACGIRYPGGYDPNTVGVVEGRVASLVRQARGPVSFRLEAGGGVYIVLAAPAWYWEEQRIEIRSGDRVRVKGSKSMGADGNLYLVAREIIVAGDEKPLILRDALGKPAWSGCGPGGCGRNGR
jgi:hypothetical protein